MVFATVVLVACGSDQRLPTIDSGGGPPGSPVVTVSGPRANESFYPTQTARVAWTATDEDPQVTCDVAALGATTIVIATGVAATSGQETAAAWVLAGTAPDLYRVQVSCTDGGGLTGVASSATFQVSAPPQVVSYATQVQPIWAACTNTQCHDAMIPQAGLDLTASTSYAALVGKPSGGCPSYQFVEPMAPERSYLVMKLQGSGPCFVGTRMPKASPALSASQLQLVRDWIYNGAPNN